MGASGAAWLTRGLVLSQLQPYSMGLSSGAYGGSHSSWMRLQAVPDQQQGAADLPAQLPEESPHLARVHIAGRMQPETQSDAAPARADDQGRDHRDLLMMARALHELGGVSARAPSAPHHRRQQQAALVDKDQSGFQSAGFLLMRGQSALTQC